METPQSPVRDEGKKKAFLPCGCQIVGVLGILFLLAGVALGPIDGNRRHAPQRAGVQAAHAIGLAMYSFANDNSQNYPDGKNSTEVFQQLLDGGYVTDPSIFYLPAPGKIRAESAQKKLKPENVCWDVTGGLSSTDPGELPLLFSTGYRVNYTPGGAAIPIPTSGVMAPRTWAQCWNGDPVPSPVFEAGIAVFRVNNSAAFILRKTAPDGTSSIPNFISRDYNPNGKTYRQLSPDGVVGQ